MKKDAIIDIIANDLKEIELLLENFRGDDYIQAQFIELLQTKHANLAREIELLNFWKSEDAMTKVEEAKPDDTPQESVVSTIAEEPKEETPVVAVEKPEEKTETETAPKATEIVPEKPDIQELKVEQAPTETVKQEPAAHTAHKQVAKASDLTNYGTPVSDIRRAIAIADRFLYQKELFGGDNEQMNAAIDAINGMDNYDEAELYLFNKYGWDPENATTTAFLKAVHRRFL